MRRGVFAEYPPMFHLLLLFVLVILSAIFVSLFGLALAIPFAGMDSVMAIGRGDATIWMYRYVQLVQSFAVFIVPSLVAARLFSHYPVNWLWFGSAKFRLMLLSVLLIFAAQPLSSWLAEVNTRLVLPSSMGGIENWMKSAEASAGNMIFKFLDTQNTGIILFNIFLMAILPGIGEELLFRGAIQPTVQRIVNNKHAAVWFTAFLFSAMHMQFLTFAPRFVLGALLGYLLVYGKSIWYPIVAHFFNNLMALLLFYYFRAAKPEINPLDVSTGSYGGWPAVVSVVVVVGLLVLFRYHHVPQKV
ncbi:CPBP family intramembrane glutamic endopeptidase [Alkalitalea saponilacus]|uniref:CAAX prenyl protease 2/Lysostaphin resistance protein A-like domain-containing protein n=1 Tax=Alkalitalea saponilacus TaxID=889453 RepID=A0A1T5DZM4_9BACT|nr:CPBP family intramembrane glutamic endopeptidase [Alkalitalea saponilacus]ASB49145.1 CPBP family intramembrane metalloprotease domain-containing protein [Alkalitalea saponilacus]SKB76970.1 hypothetical protein SAMN03080601_01168 [Alkalitalea saponilacus]